MNVIPCHQSLQTCNPSGDSLSLHLPSEVDREHLCPRLIILPRYKQTPKSIIHVASSQFRELLGCNMQLITEEEKRRKPYTSEKTIHENWVIDEKRKSARVSYTQRGDYLINRKSFETFWVATARNSSVLIKLRLQSHKQLHSSRNVLCHWVSNTIVFPSFTTQATAEVPSHLWKCMKNCGLDQQNRHLKFETHCFFSLHLV